MPRQVARGDGEIDFVIVFVLLMASDGVEVNN